MRVLLIGAGEMGSRHLQGLAGLPAGSAVAVLEPREAARAVALQRWQQMPGHDAVPLRFLEDGEGWGGFDAAILATGATGRLDLLRRVLEAGIGIVLAEKVLFQSVADYRAAVLLAAALGADVRAHVPLRHVPVLQKLRAHTRDKPFTLTVAAGDRGLGCNGIHFLDLFQYLGGMPPASVEAIIDRPLQVNRRDPALVEFTGTLNAANAAGAELRIRFSPGHERLAVLTVETADGRAVIDQAGSVESDIAGLAGLGFEMPMASRMAAGMLAGIADGSSPLPDLAEGFETNRLMLAAYNRDLAGQHADDLVCPIT
ncbi:Gfo/Idh/MocA family oxidoreductase [Oceanibaculum nanhaiense]|uniref:Gfo/Idh/MocA family oxidoreductase n=1 Tax=Oceanibaculum nanhaiense TaxID=1909734 RepID=UPI00396D98F9